jgi:hypothetical protein
VKKRSLLASLASGTVLVAVLAAPSVAQTTGVHRLLDSVGLTSQPASFTTLTLNGSDQLYKLVDWYGKTSFSFVATNEGTAPKSYTWAVTSGPQSAPRTVAHGTFSLAGKQSATEKVHFTIADCSQRNLVTVSLQGPDARQPAVHFWVLDRKSAAWKASGGPGCVG